MTDYDELQAEGRLHRDTQEISMNAIIDQRYEDEDFNLQLNPPHILDAIRMYRSLRDIGFAEARDLAIAEFRKRGWPIPESILRLEGRPPMQDFDKPITRF